MERKLRKVPGKKMISGVCAGFAYWIGAPVWLIRLLWIFAVICFGFGVLLYVLLWILMPKWQETPPDFEARCGG